MENVPSAADEKNAGGVASGILFGAVYTSAQLCF
jgi:hypothetical protein